ncbi:diguanylate cyclase [Clostridiaceae bacterium HSG29]|nr:diguanylate cyclase [Clostridiaceae bacterium HSG29]
MKKMSNMKVKLKRKLKSLSRGRRILLGLLLIVLVVGAVGSWGLVTRVDSKMREEQISQTYQIVDSINLESIKTLTGTKTDLESPNYLQLKHQLVFIQADNVKYRSVYLMGYNEDGTVFFYVDSESVDSKNYSFPGQVNEKFPNSLHHIFEDGVPLTEGLYSDKEGTWVTSLVPLIDTQSGTVLAVVGIDIEVNKWNMNVFAKVILPMGLIFLLVICLLVVWFATGQVSNSSKSILLHLLPFMAILLIILMVSGIAIIWKLQSMNISERIDMVSDNVTNDLNLTLKQQANGLSAAAQSIALDPRVLKALTINDKEHLLTDWQELFETLHQEQSLTHFYFFDVNRVCLLRIHKPEKYGDKIERYTALKAENTGKSAWGIELGPLGTFTLRVVQPVFDGQMLVGYVELGKEIEDVWQSLNVNKEIQIAVIIKKDMIQRETWELGMHMLGREVDWDRLSHSVIIYASQGYLPDAFAQLGNNDPMDDYHGITDYEITDLGRDWRVIISPLFDASDKEVGHLLKMVDITDINVAFDRNIMQEGIVSVLILSMLLGMTFMILKHTDLNIRTHQEKLRNSEEHLSATLRSIGDGVIACDVEGKVVNLNIVAEKLTGWMLEDALGKNIGDVFHIVNSQTHEMVDNPVFRAIREGTSIILSEHVVLIAMDRTECQIANSCAPIRDIAGLVTGAVLVFRDVTEEYKKSEEIKYLSFYDYLTGLFNRRFFETELTRLDTERNWPLTILMGDVNGLKIVNDTFGHTVGDKLLVKVAEIIKKSCRADDIVARIGGDEFVVLLPKTDGFEAEKLIGRIGKLCKKEEIEGVAVSISFGYATKTSEADKTKKILAEADEMMYKNKRREKHYRK